ncbi:MAG: hypothetical protein ACRDJH_10450 [Thermomicrobiales bacterium]
MSSTSASAGANLTVLDSMDWRAIPDRVDSLHPVTITGRYRHARRCIDPPALDLCPVPNAARYEVLVTSLDAPSAVHRLHVPEPRVDLAPVWARLPFGRLQIVARVGQSGAADRHRTTDELDPLTRLGRPLTRAARLSCGGPARH